MDYQKDKLTETIIDCIIKVHQTLGPGFLEGIYRRALLIELRKRHLSVTTEQEVIIYYDAQEVGRHRLDLIVSGDRIIEIKTVEHLGKPHFAQARSYLRAT